MGISVVSPVTEVVRLAWVRSPRVALLTDAASPDALPESIRDVADEVQCADLSWVGKSTIPQQLDGALVWCKGELPKTGAPPDWRRPFFAQSRKNVSVAVHWPYLEHADLLGLEPRLLSADATGNVWNPSLRIAGSHPSEKRKTAWRASGKPWARLSMALWQELDRTGSGIDALLELWKLQSSDARFSSLVLRNLIVVLMKLNNWAKAGELLELGTKAFAGSPEFPYLHGVYFILQKNHSNAVQFLETALACHAPEFVGSGGENSYRVKYLLGTICDRVGQQEKAVHYWVSSALHQPAFGPAVRALAEQKLPRGHARWLHHPLAEMARREPQYLEPVVDFLLANGLAPAGRRLVETMAIDPMRQEDLLATIEEVQSRRTPAPRMANERPGVRLTGPIFNTSGHSRINRAIAGALLDSSEFDTSLDGTTWPTLGRQVLKNGEFLWMSAGRTLDRVDLTIRHQWPPDFAPPASGKLACILPWEHRAVPVRWVEEIEAHVDEVWTPSQFTRSALIGAGVAPDRVHVLYNAIDPEIFRPDGPSTRPAGSKGFMFLFVGGAILRKGIDLLLQAYGDAFLPEDDVTLVVKDGGSRSFYSHNTKLEDVRQFAARRMSPHTIVVGDELDDTALAALYRGADAFVLPYRGEGFGMPLAEAMACGKPVITTGEGPATEFCSKQEGYLIPATEVAVPEPAPPLGRLSGEWTWFEPDVAALAKTMRHVFEHREEAANRGRTAAAAMELGFTWKRILPMYVERIRQLLPDTL